MSIISRQRGSGSPAAPPSRVRTGSRTQQRVVEIAWSVRSGSIAHAEVASWLRQHRVEAGAMVRLVIAYEGSDVRASLRAGEEELCLDAQLIGDATALKVRHQSDQVLGMQHLDVHGACGLVLRVTLLGGCIRYGATGAWAILGVPGGRYEVESGSED